MTTKQNEPEAMDRALFSQIFGILPSASPIDQKALKSIVAFRLQSVFAATAKLQDRIDELTNEAKIFDKDHADQNRMVDRIAELIGLPQDQELDTVAFELWISAQTAATAAKDAEIDRLREALTYFANRPTVAEVIEGKHDPMPDTVEARIEEMGRRKREHDEAILQARAALSEAQKPK